MPEGISDNYVDEYFLKGLVHKSKTNLLLVLFPIYPQIPYLKPLKPSS